MAKEKGDIASEIKRLSRLCRTKRLTALERLRAARNLEAVAERLESGDYTRASYAENKFNIPERIRDFFIELEFYSALGRIWQKVLERVDLRGVKSVVDLCPGSFPKVELGLIYTEYAGRVSIVDVDREAMKSASKFVNLFDPKFVLETKAADLSSLKPQKVRFDLLTANHILDDLAMYFGCKRAGMTLFEVYEKESSLLKLWECILSSEDVLRPLILGTVQHAIERLLSSGGTAIVTQYPSYVERSLKLKAVSEFNLSMLDCLGESLSKAGFTIDTNFKFRNPPGIPAIFNSSHCLVVRKVGR